MKYAAKWAACGEHCPNVDEMEVFEHCLGTKRNKRSLSVPRTLFTAGGVANAHWGKMADDSMTIYNGIPLTIWLAN